MSHFVATNMLLVYFLGAFGLAYIVGHSTLSLPFRQWLGGNPIAEPPQPGALGPFGDFLCALIECPACFGFWIGLIAGKLILIPESLEGAPFSTRAAWALWFGCVTSGTNYILGRLTSLL